MKKFGIILFLALFCFTFSSLAQEEVLIDITKTDKQLENIELLVKKQNVSSKELSEQLKIINELQIQINQAKSVYQQKKESIQKRLQALGDLPAEGIKETTDIADKRKEFTKTEEEHKAQIAQIELLNTKIEEINALILKIRNQSLLNKILTREPSVFQLQTLKNTPLKLGIFSFNMLKSPYHWYKNLKPKDRQTVNDNITFILCGFIIILISAFYLSFYIRKTFGYKDCKEEPPFFKKVISNIAMIISFGIIPAAILGTISLWLDDTKLINNDSFGKTLQLILLYLLIFFIIRAFVKVIFVPKCSYWRLFNIDDYKAKSASRTIVFWSVIVLSCDFLFRYAINQEPDYDTVYLLQIINICIKSLSIIFITRSLLYGKKEPDNTETQKNDFSLSVQSKIMLSISFLMGINFLLPLIGYVRLGEYIVNNFVLSICIIIFFITIKFLARLLLKQFFSLKFLTQVLHLNPKTLVKIRFWILFALSPALWIIAIIAILGTWGVSTDIMLHDIKKFLLGFDIGGMHISIISLLIGFCSFFISMFIFKSLRRSLLSGNLSKIEMAEDSRNSLASGISLIGFIVSIIIAIAVMGGSLSSITLIAGALSFGIGLGLQNIVNNFVSGIIIIFERPIKIGDWVIIKGQEGVVKSISMRATLLEAFDKSNIIIPNSEILSSSLVNRTYSARIGLIEITLNTRYSIDIKDFEEKLLNISASTMGILTSPAPSLAFTDFTENYLIFKLYCYTENIYSRQTIINILRTKILQEYKDKKVLFNN